MKATITYREVGSYKDLILDYVEGKEAATDFAEYLPNAEGLEKAIGGRQSFSLEQRQILARSCSNQHSDWGCVNENIDRLLNERCFTITTGHQLSIFGGPAFVLYKVLTAIKLSESLKLVHPDMDFLPVFWMATEDHDYEEIRAVNVFNKEIRIEHDHTGIVGALNVDELQQELLELEDVLGDSAEGLRIRKLLRSAYSEGNLAEATAKFWYGLLETYDFLIIDGNDAGLKTQFGPQLFAELEKGIVKDAIQATNASLKAKGYHQQAIASDYNLFEITERDRLKIKEKPPVEIPFEALSPNVLLRPVYQEFVLPNVAYIGGPGELAYWLQLKEVFHAFGTPMPVLMPRASFTLLNEKSVTTMSEFDIGVVELFDSADATVRTKVVEVDFDSGQIDAAFLAYKESLSSVVKEYPNQKQQLEAIMAKSLKELDRLKNSIEKEVKLKSAADVKAIRQLFDYVSDNGVPQERGMSLLQLLMTHSSHLIDGLYQEVEPLNFSMKFISKEGLTSQ